MSKESVLNDRTAQEFFNACLDDKHPVVGSMTDFSTREQVEMSLKSLLDGHYRLESGWDNEWRLLPLIETFQAAHNLPKSSVPNVPLLAIYILRLVVAIRKWKGFNEVCLELELNHMLHCALVCAECGNFHLYSDTKAAFEICVDGNDPWLKKIPCAMPFKAASTDDHFLELTTSGLKILGQEQLRELSAAKEIAIPPPAAPLPSVAPVVTAQVPELLPRTWRELGLAPALVTLAEQLEKHSGEMECGQLKAAIERTEGKVHGEGRYPSQILTDNRSVHAVWISTWIDESQRRVIRLNKVPNSTPKSSRKIAVKVP